jgi:hypothetical protein
MLTVLSCRLPRGRRVNAILARCGKPVARTRRGHKPMAISEGEKEGRVENTHLVKVEKRRNNVMNFAVDWKSEISEGKTIL